MSNANRNKVVIFLTTGGYKLSSYYGKILSSAYATLDAAKNACESAGYEYVVA